MRGKTAKRLRRMVDTPLQGDVPYQDYTVKERLVKTGEKYENGEDVVVRLPGTVFLVKCKKAMYKRMKQKYNSVKRR